MVRTAGGSKRAVYNEQTQNEQTQSYAVDPQSQSPDQQWDWGQVLGNTLKWTLGIGTAVIGTMAIASNLYARKHLNELQTSMFSEKGSYFNHGRQMAREAKKQNMIDSDGHFYAQWYHDAAGTLGGFKLLKGNIESAISDAKEDGASKFGGIVYKFEIGEIGEALYRGVHRSEFGTFFELAPLFSQLLKKRREKVPTT
jgi:hypothetical protein